MSRIETTRPSARTEQEGADRRPTHIRWVFPANMASRLATQLRVGREDGNDVVLPGTEISRQHAEFRVVGAVVAVRDLSSRNGTFVNGIRVADARLEVGSVVRCGEWIGVVVGCPSIDDDPLEFREIAVDLWGGARLRRALEPIRQLSLKTHVVIQGETGTGKEASAAAVHAWSRRSGKFVANNCAAIPDSLADDVLFGHVKGAFSGAAYATPGLFGEANRGTLFLDEVLELSLTNQARLLRATADKQEIQRLGDPTVVSVDVQVVVAAQKPLEVAVAEGRFREDLYSRLSGLTVQLPPLRERREDILPLFLRFLPSDSTTLEAKLVEALCVYSWPRNVRQLKSCARDLAQLHGKEGLLRKSHLPPIMRPQGAPEADEDRQAEVSGPIAASASAPHSRKPVDDAEDFERLVAALEAHGTVAKAAEHLGISRARANRVLKARRG